MTEQPFQRVWGREGGFGAATCQAAVSGLYSTMCKSLPVRVCDAINRARHPPALWAPGTRVEAHGATNKLRNFCMRPRVGRRAGSCRERKAKHYDGAPATPQLQQVKQYVEALSLVPVHGVSPDTKIARIRTVVSGDSRRWKIGRASCRERV